MLGLADWSHEERSPSSTPAAVCGIGRPQPLTAGKFNPFICRHERCDLGGRQPADVGGLQVTSYLGFYRTDTSTHTYLIVVGNRLEICNA